MDKITKGLYALATLIILSAGFYLSADVKTTDEPETSFNDSNIEVEKPESKPVSSIRDFNDAIVEIAENTNPTVVTITTTQTVRQRQLSPFSFFFDDPRFNQEREFQRSGLGSGVIVSDDGYILTNNHVIENADEIRVTLYSGEELDAEVVGTDPASDVAVLQVNSGKVPAIQLGNSDDLRVGEFVLAVGSPLTKDFAHTVSMGIVSAKGRTNLELNSYENYIQTDAAINPGNSGGALVNLDGELVGINTAIASRSGGNQGIGFAIPINMARDVMNALISDGKVTRGYLGITFGAMVDRTMAKALNLDRAYGVVVGDVEPGGPADKAGLNQGDVILKADGKEVRSWREFRVHIASKKPGETVRMEVFRDGNIQNYDIELGELKIDEVASQQPESKADLEEELGFSVENLNENIRRQLNLDNSTDGVVVTNISQGSKAFRQGLQRGDVITRIKDQNVESVDDFYSVMSKLRDEGEDAIILRIKRGPQTQFIAIEIN